MSLVIPIANRSRKFGYLYWTLDQDEKVRRTFGGEDNVGVFFNGSYIGMKHIDWKYRRIYIGTKLKEVSEGSTEFHIDYPENGILKISSR